MFVWRQVTGVRSIINLHLWNPKLSALRFLNAAAFGAIWTVLGLFEVSALQRHPEYLMQAHILAA